MTSEVVVNFLWYIDNLSYCTTAEYKYNMENFKLYRVVNWFGCTSVRGKPVTNVLPPERDNVHFNMPTTGLISLRLTEGGADESDPLVNFLGFPISWCPISMRRTRSRYWNRWQVMFIAGELLLGHYPLMKCREWLWSVSIRVVATPWTSVLTLY